jgi:hypothetical protein
MTFDLMEVITSWKSSLIAAAIFALFATIAWIGQAATSAHSHNHGTYLAAAIVCSVLAGIFAIIALVLGIIRGARTSAS